MRYANKTNGNIVDSFTQKWRKVSYVPCTIFACDATPLLCEGIFIYFLMFMFQMACDMRRATCHLRVTAARVSFNAVIPRKPRRKRSILNL